nr:transglutaminase family protein [Maliibacterium massiliense]
MEPQQETQARAARIAELLCFLCGMYGILYEVWHLVYVVFNLELLCFLVLLFCIVIWWWRHDGGAYPHIRIALGALAAVIALMGLPAMLRQWGRILDAVKTDPPSLQAIDVTATAAVFLALCAVGLYLLAFVWHKGWMFLCFSLPMVLLAQPLGKSTDWLSIGLFGAFHIGCSVLNQAERVRYASPRAGVQITSLVLVLAFCASALVAVCQLPQASMDRLFSMSEALDRQIQRIRAEGGVDAATGIVNRGNLYPEDAPRLEVTLDARPKAPLYLKGFTGGAYTGAAWEQAQDPAVLLGGELSVYLPQENVAERQCALMQWMVARGAPLAENAARIRALSPDTLDAYAPYISMRSDVSKAEYRFFDVQTFLATLDSAKRTQAILQQGAVGDVMSFYASSVYVDVDMVGALPDWYLPQENAYGQFAHGAYLDAEQARIPRIAALCAQNPLKTEEEITAFILRTLRSNTTYTLTPGNAPLGRDIAEYFLFESRRGYCQHYATTAALMYRLYGIPARYATGYVVQPDAFVRQQDGSYRAVLADAQAHAWVEVYRADAGWIPVEVTPPGTANNPSDMPYAEAVQQPQATPTPAQSAPQPTQSAPAPGIAAVRGAPGCGLQRARWPHARCWCWAHGCTGTGCCGGMRVCGRISCWCWRWRCCTGPACCAITMGLSRISAPRLRRRCRR